MSRSDQDDMERAARRARRLAERAEQRARRKAEQARRAADRAELLAQRAKQRPARDSRDTSFEERVDRMAEKWEKKAEAWIEEQSRKIFAEDGSNDRAEAAMDYGDDDGVRSAEQEARQARAEADRARRRAEEAELRASTRSRAASRRERRRARRSRRIRTISSRFNSGRGLYRDKDRGKVCGVCAGLADYLDVDTWQVRLVAVLGLVFVPSVTVPVYFITYWMMDDKPYYRRMTDGTASSGRDEDMFDLQDDENEEDMTGSRNSDKPQSQQAHDRSLEMTNAEAFQAAKQKFGDLEQRLRSMESHVTSARFELQRELRKISGDES
ncbi:MAG: PspC domain-containing protein [Pseudomonadota bacterium]